MISATSSLLRAVDALISIVEGAEQTISPELIAVRAEEAFLSWANLRPELQRGGIDPAIVERLDNLFTKFIRLTTGRSGKRPYLAQLRAIREVVNGGLHNFSIRAALLPARTGVPSTARLVPEISDLPDEIVPRSLLGWLPQMKDFLRRSPFENNVFIMVAYRKKLDPLINAVMSMIQNAEYNPVIARSESLTDELNNPLACLLCCKYGVAIFDKGETAQQHNANVVYELAVMHTLQRTCVLLKNHRLNSMPSDFLHKLYQPYRTKLEAVEKVRLWLAALRPEAAN